MVQRSLYYWGQIEIDVNFVDVPASRYAADSTAVNITTPKLIFAENQTVATASVLVQPDATPQLPRSFSLSLSSPNGSDVIVSNASQVTFTIAAHDFPNGSFVFDADSQFLVGSDPHLSESILVNITRLFGSYFQQTVLVIIGGSDRVSPMSASVIFAEGQTSASFDLLIAPNFTPQVQQSVQLMIEHVQGGGVVGTASNATLILSEHDNPNGIFVFAQSNPQTTNINSGVVMLEVSRLAGSFGTAAVQWSAISIPAQYSSLNINATGSVVFTV